MPIHFKAALTESTPLIRRAALAALLGASATVGGVGCSPDRADSVLTSVVDSVDGELVVHLTLAPSTLATLKAPDARRSWQLDSTFAGQTALTDLAVLQDGRLVATTADDDVLLILDSTGSRTDTLGRPGPGPGELRAPYIVLANDSLVVVIQADLLRTVTVFSLAGNVLRTIRTPPGGDWVAMKYRGPSLSVNGPGKRPSGMEDPTRRFALMGSTMVGIVRASEVNARGAPTGVLDQGAWVLAFDLMDGGVDTMAVFSAPPARALPPMAKDVYPLFDMPMYGAMPLVTAGPDWAAWAFGADTFVTVIRARDTLRIDWPRSSRPLNEEDRIAAILNSGAQTLRFASDETVAEFRKLGRSELHDLARQYAALWTFADSTPEVTALYTAGHCLLIAGFARDDYLDGTARTLVVVDVHTPGRAVAVTIPVPWGRIREADGEHVYVTSWSENGTPILEAYALPDIGCSTTGSGNR